MNARRSFTSHAAKLSHNRAKNRYGNIQAYDHSRVMLRGAGSGCDYINATYIKDFDGTPKTYIAAQGPLESSCNDFWQMVWQEKCSVIVMLTGLIERNELKCHQYWPSTDQPAAYGVLTVSLKKKEEFSDYTVRSLLLSKQGTLKEVRLIHQYQFTSWPHRGVPQQTAALLRFRKNIINRSPHVSESGPWIIHCSAGVGRTGIFLVIDAMLRQAKEKKVVDIYNYVHSIEEDRPYIIQTKDQYVFIHQTILEALIAENKRIKRPHLHGQESSI
ncbi:predicted protein [Nematostella vectensis]|uniref:protein-tyrosine-phosphatase n=1 Tax=Nematostella vectensis TaxID=45351 RepID=A7RL98_NEMVE|nr:predicted protein [Nematostella vectensis]|eukprot:XP_001639956.1 predicted protein [Nematostella vectensis]